MQALLPQLLPLTQVLLPLPPHPQRLHLRLPQEVMVVQ
jgi:hypothetical protein